MKNENQETIRNIINVNYAGEYGAIRLYRSHIFIAKFFYRDLVDTLKKIQNDEREHCKLFRNIMPEYNMTPCHLTIIWGLAGSALGLATALTGRRSLLLCVSAAEETAHTHLTSQIRYLEGYDTKLADIIRMVDAEEKNHISLSDKHLNIRPLSRFDKIRHDSIYKICQATMWIVTKGKSSELRKTLEK